ncbi:macro domain-containing protein [Laspinema olomoucense]|uniref:macro domain-containing protein n=1 Tax=Laspinema olomoucense TaxID=3231600 RepID=UPI0021BAAC07|nr:MULTISPECIES: macro domain-containing protein [unclassified Laspinema]MCT7996269.1 macro domain-containing protein [Laspinema sp. D3c]
MNIKVIRGNLFTSNCQTLVNTVNCVGVMGAGIALEFRLRYPKMYSSYVELCQKNLLDVGQLWLYKSSRRWVLNFPTKKHWKNPSQVKFLELGLQKFVDTYRQKEITSIAFPLLGTQHGGIPQEKSLEIMKFYLGQCDLPIEIYIYDPGSTDDIFPDIKSRFLSLKDETIVEITGLKQPYINKVKEALLNDSISSISSLLSVKGIGITTVEKTLLVVKKN